ncbi:O-antigen ligase family protein [Flavobacteriaceae bacterium D16]|nr:O-antigen ligase family protein [Flavobacteriaceae bacterium D16]
MLFVGVLPLWPILSSLTLILLISLHVIFRSKSGHARPFDLLLFAVPFIGYLVSFSYAYDMVNAGMYLIRILPILILPVLFFFSNNESFPARQALRSWFVYGMLISMGFALLLAFFTYVRTGAPEVFTYYYLAENMKLHPTYYSLYALTALHFLWQGGFKSGVRVLGSALLILFIGLLQSKIAFIILILMIFLYLLFKWKSIWVRIVTIAALLSVFALFIFQISTRVTEDMRGIDKYDEPLIGTFKENGVTQRMWLFKEALPQITEKPWIGYGLKSQREIFSWKVHKNGLMEEQSFAYRNAAWTVSKLNLHNQYLQVLYEGGIFGLILFLIPLGWILSLAFKDKNWFFLFPFGMFLLILTSENLLDRQMGIYFFAIFLPLLYLAKEKPVRALKIEYNKYRVQ